MPSEIEIRQQDIATIIYRRIRLILVYLSTGKIILAYTGEKGSFFELQSFHTPNVVKQCTIINRIMYD